MKASLTSRRILALTSEPYFSMFKFFKITNIISIYYKHYPNIKTHLLYYFVPLQSDHFYVKIALFIKKIISVSVTKFY